MNGLVFQLLVTLYLNIINRVSVTAGRRATDSSEGRYNRFIHIISNDKQRIPLRSSGSQLSSCAADRLHPENSVRVGFFDRTFPTRKPFHVGCKIGDLHHLSRHSYSDLDCDRDDSNLIKSTTASNLRVHFALEDVAYADCSCPVHPAPVNQTEITHSDCKIHRLCVSVRSKAFTTVNKDDFLTHNDYCL